MVALTVYLKNREERITIHTLKRTWSYVPLSHLPLALFGPWEPCASWVSTCLATNPPPPQDLQGWIQSSSSDLHKSLKFFPNLISQLFIAVDEINYLPCFIVYYEINKTTERLFRRSHSKPSPSRAKWTSHCSRGFVLCWSFENHAKKISQAGPDKVST